MWERDESVGSEAFFVGALVDDDVEQRCGQAPVGGGGHRFLEDDLQGVVAALGVGAWEQGCGGVGSVDAGSFSDVSLELTLNGGVEDGDHFGGGDRVAARGPQVQGAVEVGDGGGAGGDVGFAVGVGAVEVGQ